MSSEAKRLGQLAEDLRLYAILGEATIVEATLASGADPDAPDPVEGTTALMEAARKGHVEVVAILLGSGASPDLLNRRGEMALDLALRRGHAAVVQRLLAVQELEERHAGWTALHEASRLGHTEVAMVLLEDGGADPDTANVLGETALMVAAREGHVDVVQALLEDSADPDARSKHGSTALTIASAEGRDDIAMVLLEFGADVDLQDEHGHTALLHASRAGHFSLVRKLLGSGATAYAGKMHTLGGQPQWFKPTAKPPMSKSHSKFLRTRLGAGVPRGQMRRLNSSVPLAGASVSNPVGHGSPVRLTHSFLPQSLPGAAGLQVPLMASIGDMRFEEAKQDILDQFFPKPDHLRRRRRQHTEEGVQGKASELAKSGLGKAGEISKGDLEKLKSRALDKRLMDVDCDDLLGDLGKLRNLILSGLRDGSIDAEELLEIVKYLERFEVPGTAITSLKDALSDGDTSDEDRRLLQQFLPPTIGDERVKFKQTLTIYQGHIKCFFRYFANDTDKGMTGAEFARMAKECSVLDHHVGLSVIDKVFIRANQSRHDAEDEAPASKWAAVQKAVGSKVDRSLGIGEFTGALIRLSAAKYHKTIGLHDRFFQFMTAHLLKHRSVFITDDTISDEMQRDEVQEVLEKFKVKMVKIFQKYGTKLTKDYEMTLPNFMDMCKSCDLYDDKLTMREARAMFLLVNTDDELQASSVTNDRAGLVLDFHEFEECIARLASEKTTMRMMPFESILECFMLEELFPKAMNLDFMAGKLAAKKLRKTALKKKEEREVALLAAMEEKAQDSKSVSPEQEHRDTVLADLGLAFVFGEFASIEHENKVCNLSAAHRSRLEKSSLANWESAAKGISGVLSQAQSTLHRLLVYYSVGNATGPNTKLALNAAGWSALVTNLHLQNTCRCLDCQSLPDNHLLNCLKAHRTKVPGALWVTGREDPRVGDPDLIFLSDLKQLLVRTAYDAFAEIDNVQYRVQKLLEMRLEKHWCQLTDFGATEREFAGAQDGLADFIELHREPLQTIATSICPWTKTDMDVSRALVFLEHMEVLDTSVRAVPNPKLGLASLAKLSKLGDGQHAAAKLSKRDCRFVLLGQRLYSEPASSYNEFIRAVVVLCKLLSEPEQPIAQTLGNFIRDTVLQVDITSGLSHSLALSQCKGVQVATVLSKTSGLGAKLRNCKAAAAAEEEGEKPASRASSRGSRAGSRADSRAGSRAGSRSESRGSSKSAASKASKVSKSSKASKASKPPSRPSSKASTAGKEKKKPKPKK